MLRPVAVPDNKHHGRLTVVDWRLPVDPQMSIDY
jgi:hypothetical protein